MTTSKSISLCANYNARKFWMDAGVLYGLFLLFLGGFNLHLRNESGKDCHLCGDLNYSTQVIGIMMVISGTLTCLACMVARGGRLREEDYLGLFFLFGIPEAAATLAAVILFFRTETVNGISACTPIFQAANGTSVASNGCDPTQLKLVFGSLVFKSIPLFSIALLLVVTLFWVVLERWFKSLAEDLPRIVDVPTFERIPLRASANTV